MPPASNAVLPFGFAHCYLKKTAHHQPRIVLVFHAVVEFRVLAHDLSLIPRLLRPLDVALPRPGHRSRIRSRPGARQQEHGIASTPCGVNAGPIIQRSHVHVGRGRRRPAGDHAGSKRCVDRSALVGHGVELRRGPSPCVRASHGFLVVAELGSRHKVEVIDATQLHGCDDRVRPLFGGVLPPTGVGC